MNERNEELFPITLMLLDAYALHFHFTAYIDIRTLSELRALQDVKVFSLVILNRITNSHLKVIASS